MSENAKKSHGALAGAAPLDISESADRIAQAIRRASRIAVITHARADADAVGSTIAFAHLCEHLGSRPALVTSGDLLLPDSLRFMDASGVFHTQLEGLGTGFDLVAYIDCAEAPRAAPVTEQLHSWSTSELTTINIDHHVTNTRYATIDLVQDDAASTAEILVQLFHALDVPISAGLATALLAGIYGDTLGLKTPSTKPSTMRACADLVEAGAFLDLVVDRLFREKPYSTVLLWGEAQLRSQWSGRLLWTRIDNALLDQVGASSTETEGLVNFLAGTHGAFAAALVQESDDGWRVSLRSTTGGVDVSALAQRYGGGGHPRAAGCQLSPGEEALAEFIADISAQLEALPEHAGSREPYVTSSSD